MPVLRNGDDSPWVSEAQRALEGRGFYRTAIDGDFGNEPAARARGLAHVVGPSQISTPGSVALLFPRTRFENRTA